MIAIQLIGALLAGLTIAGLGAWCVLAERDVTDFDRRCRQLTEELRMAIAERDQARADLARLRSPRRPVAPPTVVLPAIERTRA